MIWVALLSIGCIAALLTSPFWMPEGAGYLGTHFKSRNDLVVLIEDLLRKAPEWQIDRYHATHPLGISIWVANRAYALHADFDSQRLDLSFFDKHRLWRAFKQIGSQSNNGPASELSQRIIARYGDGKIVPFSRRAA